MIITTIDRLLSFPDFRYHTGLDKDVSKSGTTARHGSEHRQTARPCSTAHGYSSNLRLAWLNLTRWTAQSMPRKSTGSCASCHRRLAPKLPNKRHGVIDAMLYYFPSIYTQDASLHFSIQYFIIHFDSPKTTRTELRYTVFIQLYLAPVQLLPKVPFHPTCHSAK